MENWTTTDPNDWFGQYNIYGGVHQPIEYSQFSSLTNALGFPETTIASSFGQPPPLPSDGGHGAISPLVASEPSPATSSVDTPTITSQSSSTPSVRPPSEAFIPMPLYGDEGKIWAQRRTNGDPLAYHYIRFLPWGRTTKSFGGVPMNDCLSMRENSMSGAHDPVFSFQAANHISFMLKWPGYDDLQWVTHIPVWTDCIPITRAQLACWIAHEFWKFFEECKAGSYGCSEPEWKVGQGRVTFDRIKLESIWSPEDGLWLASVQIIQP